MNIEEARDRLERACKDALDDHPAASIIAQEVEALIDAKLSPAPVGGGAAASVPVAWARPPKKDGSERIDAFVLTPWDASNMPAGDGWFPLYKHAPTPPAKDTEGEGRDALAAALRYDEGRDDPQREWFEWESRARWISACSDLEARLAEAERRAADDFEHYVRNAIDSAPEPVRRLGEYLTEVLDEDQWAHADPIMMAIARDFAEARTVAAQNAARAKESDEIADNAKRALADATKRIEALAEDRNKALVLIGKYVAAVPYHVERDMSRLTELNEARAQAREYVTMLGMVNTAIDPAESLAQSARYQLAMDAWHRAETEYRAELRNTSTASLMSLSGVSAPRT